MRRVRFASHLALVAGVFLCCAFAASAAAQDRPVRVAVQDQFEKAIELFQAAQLEQAATVLDEVLNVSTSKELLILREKIDRELLAKMLLDEKTGLAMRKLLRKAAAESERVRRDAEAIQKMVKDLGSDNVVVRWCAIKQLTVSGPFAIPHLLDHVTSDETSGDSRRVWAEAAIREMHTDAIPPMIVALRFAADAAATRIANLLLDLPPDARAAPVLVGILESEEREAYVKAVARRALRRILSEARLRKGKRADKARTFPSAAAACRVLARRYYYEDPIILEATKSGDRVIWSWDADGEAFSEKLVSEDVPAYAFSRLMAEGLILEGLKSKTSGPKLLELHLCNTYLRYAKAEANDAEDAEKLADRLLVNQTLSVETFYSALGRGLRDGHTGLARYCIESLRSIGDSRPPKGPNTLLTALAYPDRLVRVAAAETVMYLSPGGEFGGVRSVVRVLASGLGLRARPTVVILTRDRRLAKRISQSAEKWDLIAKVHTDPARTLGQARHKTPPVDLIVLDSRLRGSKSTGLVDALSKDDRTAALPVVVLATPEQLQTVSEMYANKAAAVLALDYDEESLKSALLGGLEAEEAGASNDVRENAELLQRLLATAAAIPPGTRYPARALAWGAAGLLKGYPDEIRSPALDVMANIPDARVRDAAFELYADADAPVELRDKAGATFRKLLLISPRLEADQVAVLRKIMSGEDPKLRAHAIRALSVTPLPQAERKAILLSSDMESGE